MSPYKHLESILKNGSRNIETRFGIILTEKYQFYTSLLLKLTLGRYIYVII